MLSGDKIGRYRIVSKIGEGGMGEVYLAEDAKLGRNIALKILPAKVASDTDRMLRFEHEAKSASALNHPNIITIYEINDEEGELFIAMEYVEGQTLAKKIKSQELGLRQTLDVAIQIAAALTAAHEASVIHRDIKPDNIIIRPDGLVKVLDFGLAKLTEKTSVYDLEALTTLVKTSPGLIMGTVGYMSPEQARGRSVDGRSDIFSFGSMLYEMISGRRPFTGENEVDVIASIIHQEPQPLSELAPNTPYELETLVRKTLRKDREERYQSMPELLADLRDIRERLTSEINAGRSQTNTRDIDQPKFTGDGYSRPLATGGRSGFGPDTIPETISRNVSFHPLIIAGIVLATVAAMVYGGSRLYRSMQRQKSFQTMRMAKLTSTGNVASEQAAVSPDGKYIAYVIKEAGQESLWLKQTGTASNVLVVPEANVSYSGITFSPDGGHILYSASDASGLPTVYQVPVLGGPSRKLIEDARGPVVFSPDGSRIAFVRKETGLMTAKADGTEAITVASASLGRRWLRLAWAPDGKSLAAIVFSAEDSRDHLVEVDLTDGQERPLSSSQWLRLRGLAWLPDGSGVVVSGRDLETQMAQLWMVESPESPPRRITNDLSSYQGLTLTADGRTIVSVQENTLSNIWTASDDFGSPRKLTAELGRDEGMSGLSFAPDGSIVYTVRIKGTQDLWVVKDGRDGAVNQQVTFDSKSNFSPSVTPDGRYIVFISTRGGNPGIWRMNIDGSSPVQLTDTSGSEADPIVTPDGKWIVYQFVDAQNNSTIWKVGIDGGQPVQVTDIKSERPSVSPDGKFVACVVGGTSSDPLLRVAIVPIDGRKPYKILDLPMVVRSRTIRWSPDGRSLIYFGSSDKVYNLWRQPLEGGPPKQLTNIKSDRIFRFDIARDGRSYAFAGGNEASDAVMISDFR